MKSVINSRNALLKSFAAALTAMAAWAPLAQAHPGHSLGDVSAVHLLSNSDHLAVLAVGGTALCFLARAVHVRLPRRVLQVGGTLVFAFAVVVWGLRG